MNKRGIKPFENKRKKIVHSHENLSLTSNTRFGLIYLILIFLNKNAGSLLIDVFFVEVLSVEVLI